MKKMTTLNALREHYIPSWAKLLASLGKTHADDAPLSFGHLLDVLGIVEAVWCLRALDYKEQCLFLADVAESVLPDFEKHSNDMAPSKYMAPRKCVQAIRDYERGVIDEVGLKAAADAAYTTATDIYAADAAYAAAADEEGCQAYTAATAAYADTYAAAYAAAYAADADTADAADTYAAARVLGKGQEIEAVFVKHFVAD